MKHYLRRIIILATVLVSMFLLAEAAFAGTWNVKDTDIEWTDGVSGGAIYFDLDTGTITGCSDEVTKAVIPAQINGRIVTVIGESAFSSCSKLSEITIPDGVTNIETDAFGQCTALTKVAIPNSVTSLGERAFNACYALNEVTLSNSLTRLETAVFISCMALKSVKIPSSVTSIGDWAFNNCTALNEVTISRGVTIIGMRAFAYCSSLNEIVIPNSVTSIGEAAFDSCANFENVFVESQNSYYKSVDGILYDSNMKQLIYCPDKKSEVEIPESVTKIGDWAFAQCSQISKVRIPSNVTSVGDWAFKGCTLLSDITFPNGLEYIGQGAFSECSELGEIIIPNTMTTINDWTFSDCKALKKVMLPNSVTSIGESSFYSCESLSEITIPSSVTSIGRSAFSFTALREITMPDSVTNIGYGAFSHCKSLKKVTLPSKLTKIEGETFHLCEVLNEITIPNSVTSIGHNAFSGCASLKQITIPNSVTSIGAYAFKDCSALEQVNIPNRLANIEESMFANCKALREIVIPSCVTSIGKDAFSSCISLSKVTIANNSRLSRIGSHAFYCCKSLGEIAIPEGVTNIDDWAFYGCESLNKVILPNSLTNVGKDLFYGCKSLTRVAIPIGMTKVGYGMFWHCKSLREVTIPNSVTNIDDYAFYDCLKLNKVNIPNSVRRIGDSAFFSCDSLRKITIPSSVTSIDDDAFSIFMKLIIGEKGSCAERYARKNDITFKTPIEAAITEISAAQYGIYVVDSEGHSLAGATVTFDGISKETNNNGLAMFDAWTVGEPTISVSKDGYETWSNKTINYEKSSNGYEVITLYTTNETSLRTVSALYNENLNLCIVTKKITLPYKSLDTTFSLRIKTKKANVAAYFELWQNAKMIARTDSKGIFSGLKASLFSEGKGIYIKACDANKKSYITPINLIFVGRDFPKIKQIELGGGSLEFTIGKSVPVLGGKKIKLSGLGKIPVVVKTKDDTLYFTINMYDSSESDTEFNKKQWEKFKRIRNIPKGGYTTDNTDELKKLFKEAGAKKLSGNITVKTAGCGSIKMEQIGKVSQVEMDIYLLIEAKGSVTFQTVIAVVPVTANFTLSGSVKGETSATIDLKTNKIGAEFTVTGGLKLSAFGGVGAGKVVSAGLYGEGKLDAEYVALSDHEPQGLKSLVLGWNLGLKSYFIGFEQEIPIIGNKYYLYERTQRPMKMPAAAGNQGLEQLYDISSYKPQDVSYLVHESAWLGQGFAPYRLNSLQSGQNSGTGGAIEIQPLLTNTYEDSQPTIAASSDNMAIAYLRADTSRNVYNMTQVMYSVFDEATGTWGEPKALDSADVTGDYAPQLFSDGKDIFLIYQDSSRVFDEESSDISEYAKAQTIKATVFDAATQTFTNIAALSPSDEDGVKYHSQPRLGLVDGVLTAAWVANGDAEDVFGQNAGNEIWAAQYIDGQWQTANKLLEEENCIADLTVGNSGIAYMRDEDNNLATDTDRSLRLLSMDRNTVEIASGKLSGLKISELNGEKVLTWLNEDGLYKYANDAELVCADFGAAEYQIAGDNIYFTASEDETSSNLYKAIYDAQTKTYQSAAALTDSSEYVENVSVADFKGRTYAALVQSQVTLSEDAVDRKCDLAWCRLNEVTDLTLVSADYEQADVVAGSALPVQLQLRNNGTTDIETVNITITDASGNTAYGAAETIGLTPGQETELTVNLTMPDSITKAAYNLSVSASEEDKNPADNETSLTIGYADLAVSHELVQIGNQQSLCVTVSNDGFTSSAGTLTVSCGEESTYETQVEALEHGENTTFIISLSDMELSNGESGTVDVSVTAEAEEKELSNNTEKVYLGLDYEITYFAGSGGNDERPFLQENKRYDETFEITGLSPVKSGYRLAGWSRESGSQEAEYQALDYLDDNRNVTLYAVWEKNTSPAGRIYGDIDGNDKVDFADALYLKRHIAGWDAYKTIDTVTSDLNNDGEVNIRDLMLLEQHIAGWTGSGTLPAAK